MKKRFGVLSLIVSCIVGILIAGAGAGIYFAINLGGPASYSAAVKFASIYNILDTMFIGEADMDAVTDAAYNAMVDAIDDDWSYYLTLDEYESYKEIQQNSYTGIGVTIEPEAGSAYLRVYSVAKDSPAKNAGVKAGDYLYAIDGVSLEDKTINDVKVLISEKDGAEFELTLSDEKGEERTVRLAAGLIFSDPVAYYMMEDGIGYIKIENFEAESGERSIAAMDDLIAQGATGIVFDVRNNPGGLLSELTLLLDHILPEGDVFVSVSKNGKESVSTSDADCVDIPMTVLINSDSYSAAEFFAAALWEYGVAKTVGVPTTGKSRSQINFQLPDGSAVHLSTNGYLTPNRVDLAEQGGLVPDYTVELSEDDERLLLEGELYIESDEQLLTAKRVLLEASNNQ